MFGNNGRESFLLFCSHNVQPKCIVNKCQFQLTSHCHNSSLMLMAGRSGPIKDDRKMSHWPKLRNSQQNISLLSHCFLLYCFGEFVRTPRHFDSADHSIYSDLLTHTFWFGSSRYKRQNNNSNNNNNNNLHLYSTNLYMNIFGCADHRSQVTSAG